MSATTPTPTPEAARHHAEVRDLALKIKATIVDDGDGPFLVLDCVELMRSPNDIRFWRLDSSESEPHLWHHGQSHGDWYFPLANCILGIAAVYTNRHNPILPKPTARPT